MCRNLYDGYYNCRICIAFYKIILTLITSTAFQKKMTSSELSFFPYGGRFFSCRNMVRGVLPSGPERENGDKNFTISIHDNFQMKLIAVKFIPRNE